MNIQQLASNARNSTDQELIKEYLRADDPVRAELAERLENAFSEKEYYEAMVDTQERHLPEVHRATEKTIKSLDEIRDYVSELVETLTGYGDMPAETVEGLVIDLQLLSQEIEGGRDNICSVSSVLAEWEADHNENSDNYG